jgi:hypothetical protein
MATMTLVPQEATNFSHDDRSSWTSHQSVIGEGAIQGTPAMTPSGTPRRPVSRADFVLARHHVEMLKDVVEEVVRRQRDAQEMRWIADHGAAYSGRWIAIAGNRLLAEGNTAKQVYDAIRGSHEHPLVVKIEAADKAPFGGW